MALHRQILSPTGEHAHNPDSDPSPGTETTTPLILSHGFSQNSECWGRFGRLLARARRTIAVDGPGHGRSGHDDADLDRAAVLLGESGGPGIHIGYSMGGRVALHLALAAPELVTGLVLIGATAGIDDEPGRAERRRADQDLADRLLANGLDQFLRRWLAGPLFADLTEEQAALEARLTNRAEGLAASLRNCGTGTQEPLWGRLPELTMPVLLVVGQDDGKFTDIAHRLAETMTGTAASLVSLPGTHAVHLEQPVLAAEAILHAITDW